MARILVIDDEGQIRTILRTILVQLGHEVLEATSGSDGIRVYQERPADLVITDMFMPVGSGLGCITELRRLNPGVRIIAMSGGGTSTDLLEMALGLGADCTFSKPFHLGEMLAAIQEELRARRAA